MLNPLPQSLVDLEGRDLLSQAIRTLNNDSIAALVENTLASKTIQGQGCVLSCRANHVGQFFMSYGNTDQNAFLGRNAVVVG